MPIQLSCPEDTPCSGEYLYQYIEPMSELNETVIECDKCGRFLKTSQPIEGLQTKEQYNATSSDKP